MALINEHHPNEQILPTQEPTRTEDNSIIYDDEPAPPTENLDDAFAEPQEQATVPAPRSRIEQAYIDQARSQSRKHRAIAAAALTVSLLFVARQCTAEPDTPASRSDTPTAPTTVPCLIDNHPGCPTTTITVDTSPDTTPPAAETTAPNFDITRILPTDAVFKGTLPNGEYFEVPRLRRGADVNSFTESFLSIFAAYITLGNQTLLDELSSQPVAQQELRNWRTYYLGAVDTYTPANRKEVVANVYTNPKNPVSFGMSKHNITITSGELYLSANADLTTNPAHTEWGDDNTENFQQGGRNAINTTLLPGFRLFVDDEAHPTKVFEVQIGAYSNSN